MGIVTMCPVRGMERFTVHEQFPFHFTCRLRQVFRREASRLVQLIDPQRVLLGDRCALSQFRLLSRCVILCCRGGRRATSGNMSEGSKSFWLKDRKLG
jgi:hypothetical protein